MIGALVGTWYSDAQRRWLNAMARRGLIPRSGDELFTRGWLTPLRTSRDMLATIRHVYPQTQKSEFADVELWRVRRRRRRQIYFGWMIGGVPFAAGLIAIIDAAYDQPAWLLLLLPIAAGMAFLGRTVRSWADTI